MKNRFEVSTKGMAELQSGREPWQLAKELVSNAWDESTTRCTVGVVSITPMTASVLVTDDGSGFSSIEDAWTVFGHTNKRLNPNSRGRFNVGEKEIISIAKEATIRTSGKIIRFPKEGGRSVRKDAHPIKGTIIECIVPWGTRQVETCIEKLKELLPPKGMEYLVNGERVSYTKPLKVVEGMLDTVIQASLDEPLKNVRRKTSIEIYDGALPTHKVYEMGIPIQDVECQFSVNVLQKVPMPPNRDVVRDRYLKELYAIVAEAMIDYIPESRASDGWLRLAVESKQLPTATLEAIKEKRFGEKVVLWSSDTEANETAEHKGFKIIPRNVLSPEEKEAYATVGVVSAKEEFGSKFSGLGNSKSNEIPEDRWGMAVTHITDYAKWLAQMVLGHDITVTVYSEIGDHAGARCDGRRLYFNKAELGNAWFEQITEKTTSLLLHEFAHSMGDGHDTSYNNHLSDLAAKAVHLAVAKPEEFKKWFK